MTPPAGHRPGPRARMIREKRTAFACVQQDGLLGPDAVGEPILRTLLAEGIAIQRIRARAL